MAAESLAAKHVHRLEENEASNGWPLGLEIMTIRLQLMESSPAAPAESYAFRMHSHSSSFSSFSSSNLDTQSTASFFQDNSVPLGRLIGFRPGEGGLYFPHRIHLNERERISARAPNSEVARGREADTTQRICIPLLLSTFEKMSRSKSRSRQ